MGGRTMRRVASALTVAIVVAVTVGGPAHAVAWTGSISEFSASPAVIEAGGSSTLSMHLSESIPYGTGYVQTIYDDTEHLIAKCSWPTVNGCSATVRPALNTTRTYTAYVSLDSPTTGPPVVDVRASAQVSVSNIGWIGQIDSFTATPSTIEAGGSSTLSMHLSQSIPSGAYVQTIYDDAGHQIAKCSWPTVNGCSATVRPALNTTRTYAAFVSLDSPTTGPPVQDVRASAQVSVSNIGWTGQIESFTADPAFLVGGGRSTLSMHLSSYLPTSGGFYIESIYDDSAHRVAACTYPRLNDCSATVTVPSGDVRLYQAFVATDAPSDHYPVSNVAASSGPLVVSGASPDEALFAPTTLALEDELVALYGSEQACLALGLAIDTHALESTAPDVTLVCNAKGLQSALRFAMLATGGAAGATVAVTALWHAVHDGGDPANYDPDCETRNSVGDCLDGGSPGQLTVEDISDDPVPEPAAAGAGIPPLNNCLGDEA